MSPDGRPTESGVATLKAIKAGAGTPSQIATATNRQLFLVRSGLRELVGAGFIENIEDRYQLTPSGEKIITA
jgi:predicted transcriptional regulator